MGYKLVALDLDGTLLSEDKAIADSTSKLIKEARNSGVKFTIATGRMSSGAIRYAKQLGIDIPIITYNGAVIRNLASGYTYREYKVPAEGAMDAIDMLKGEPALRFVFLGDDVYTDTPHEWTDGYAELLEVKMNFVDDVRDLLAQDPTMLVFMVPTLRAVELAGVLKAKLNSQVRITNSTDWFLDILHPKASKGLALRQLAESLGVAREEIIAIGDNLNDLEMVEYAGIGVAVANATDDLKAAADYVTDLPLSEGVGEVIMKYVLSEPDLNDSLFAPNISP
ncbi:MAG: HAD family phosphatase [Actinobacteria bacterium]|nr:HAD family phosphatase [Actinomycetota bacterium]